MTSKSARFHSQAHRASGSKKHAPSAETKSKTYWFLGSQHQVLRVKQSLTAQRATRRAQRDKPKLRLRESLHRVYGTKQHAWGFEKPRTKVHKSRKPVRTCSLNLNRRTDFYIYDLYLSIQILIIKYLIVKLI